MYHFLLDQKEKYITWTEDPPATFIQKIKKNPKEPQNSPIDRIMSKKDSCDIHKKSKKKTQRTPKIHPKDRIVSKRPLRHSRKIKKNPKEPFLTFCMGRL
jgi:hypothetical protein